MELEALLRMSKERVLQMVGEASEFLVVVSSSVVLDSVRKR